MFCFQHSSSEGVSLTAVEILLSKTKKVCHPLLFSGFSQLLSAFLNAAVHNWFVAYRDVIVRVVKGFFSYMHFFDLY